LQKHPEGWYHKIGDTQFGDYISIHYLTRLDDVMRSRCGQRAKDDNAMKELVLIGSPDEWKRVQCGNCRRLIAHDTWKRNLMNEN